MLTLLVFACIFRKKVHVAFRFALASLLVFYVFSNPFVYKVFCHRWEIFTPKLSEIDNYEMAVVLGGMTEYDGDLEELTVRRGADRIWQAISLYKMGKIRKILISGDSGYVTSRGLKEAKQLKEVLVRWGIPENDLVVEEVSRNTCENAVESYRIIQQSYPHIDKVLLITSARHMRRASACFDKVGLQHDLFTTDKFTGVNNYIFWDEYFVPQASIMDEWSALIKEWVGYISYRIVGYI